MKPLLSVAVIVIGVAFASAEETHSRPGLMFREDFRETPAATPITQEHIVNPTLVLSLHGPAAAKIKKSHHDRPADDPFYVWSGDADANWAISLKPRNAQMDLSGQAKVKWRAKQTGYRQLRLIIKLASGPWLVSDRFDGDSVDWRECEFVIADLKWRVLDITKVVEGRWEPNPNLSRVEEIGVTDLMRGGGTPASSRLDWIEVYARPVTR